MIYIYICIYVFVYIGASSPAAPCVFFISALVVSWLFFVAAERRRHGAFAPVAPQLVFLDTIFVVRFRFRFVYSLSFFSRSSPPSTPRSLILILILISCDAFVTPENGRRQRKHRLRGGKKPKKYPAEGTCAHPDGALTRHLQGPLRASRGSRPDWPGVRDGDWSGRGRVRRRVGCRRLGNDGRGLN